MNKTIIVGGKEYPVYNWQERDAEPHGIAPDVQDVMAPRQLGIGEVSFQADTTFRRGEIFTVKGENKGFRIVFADNRQHRAQPQ